MKVKVCPVCGKEFKAERGQRKFCSDECFRKARREYDRQIKRKRAEAQKGVPVTSEHTGVDEKLRSCHAAGQTYAQAQRAETIEKFARVEVPEAFMTQTAETPEKPAKEKIMFLSREEREALIRIQVQVETLQEFFKCEGLETGMDYPSTVLGRVLAQVTQLLGEGEATGFCWQ